MNNSSSPTVETHEIIPNQPQGSEAQPPKVVRPPGASLFTDEELNASSNVPDPGTISKHSGGAVDDDATSSSPTKHPSRFAHASDAQASPPTPPEVVNDPDYEARAAALLAFARSEPPGAHDLLGSDTLQTWMDAQLERVRVASGDPNDQRAVALAPFTKELLGKVQSLRANKEFIRDVRDILLDAPIERLPSAHYIQRVKGLGRKYDITPPEFKTLPLVARILLVVAYIVSHQPVPFHIFIEDITSDSTFARVALWVNFELALRHPDELRALSQKMEELEAPAFRRRSPHAMYDYTRHALVDKDSVLAAARGTSAQVATAASSGEPPKAEHFTTVGFRHAQAYLRSKLLVPGLYDEAYEMLLQRSDWQINPEALKDLANQRDYERNPVATVAQAQALVIKDAKLAHRLHVKNSRVRTHDVMWPVRPPRPGRPAVAMLPHADPDSDGSPVLLQFEALPLRSEGADPQPSDAAVVIRLTRAEAYNMRLDAYRLVQDLASLGPAFYDTLYATAPAWAVDTLDWCMQNGRAQQPFPDAVLGTDASHSATKERARRTDPTAEKEFDVRAALADIARAYGADLQPSDKWRGSWPNTGPTGDNLHPGMFRIEYRGVGLAFFVHYGSPLSLADTSVPMNRAVLEVLRTFPERVWLARVSGRCVSVVPSMLGGSSEGMMSLAPPGVDAPITPSTSGAPSANMMAASSTDQAISAATAAAENNLSAAAKGNTSFSLVSAISNPVGTLATLAGSAVAAVPSALSSAVDVGIEHGWKAGVSKFLESMGNATLGTKITGWLSKIVGTAMCDEVFSADPSIAITMAAYLLFVYAGDETLPFNTIAQSPTQCLATWAQMPNVNLVRGMELFQLSFFAGTSAYWFGNAVAANSQRAMTALRPMRFFVPTLTFGGVQAAESALLTSVAQSFQAGTAKDLSQIWKSYNANAASSSGSFGMYVLRALGIGPNYVVNTPVYMRYLLSICTEAAAPGDNVVRLSSAQGQPAIPDMTYRVGSTKLLGAAAADYQGVVRYWPSSPSQFQAAWNVPAGGAAGAATCEALYIDYATLVELQQDNNRLNIPAAFLRPTWDVTCAVVPVQASLSGSVEAVGFALTHMHYPFHEAYYDASLLSSDGQPIGLPPVGTAPNPPTTGWRVVPDANLAIIPGPRNFILFVAMDGVTTGAPAAQQFTFGNVPVPLNANAPQQVWDQLRTFCVDSTSWFNTAPALGVRLGNTYGLSGWQEAVAYTASAIRHCEPPTAAFYQNGVAAATATAYALSGCTTATPANEPARSAPGAPSTWSISTIVSPLQPFGAGVGYAYNVAGVLDPLMRWHSSAAAGAQSTSSSLQIPQCSTFTRLCVAAGYLTISPETLPSWATRAVSVVTLMHQQSIRMASYSSRFLYHCPAHDTGYIKRNQGFVAATSVAQVWPLNVPNGSPQRSSATVYQTTVQTHMISTFVNNAPVVVTYNPSGFGLLAQYVDTVVPGPGKITQNQVSMVGMASMIPIHVHIWASSGRVLPEEYTGDYSNIFRKEDTVEQRLGIVGYANVAPNAQHFFAHRTFAPRDAYSFMALDHNAEGGPVMAWSSWQLAISAFNKTKHYATAIPTLWSPTYSWDNLLYLCIDPQDSGATLNFRRVRHHWGYWPANLQMSNNDSDMLQNFDTNATWMEMLPMRTDVTNYTTGATQLYKFAPAPSMSAAAKVQ